METLSTTQATNVAARYPAMVERLYRQLPGSTVQGERIENTIRNYFAGMSAQNHTWKRETFYRLLMLMHNKRCFAVLKNPAFIGVLANISAFGNKTVRPVEGWVKDSLTPEGQLESLIRYLFATYDVPAFMEYVFAEGSKVHMLWYVQLGRGDSVKQLCAFPAAFTGKMAHAFRNTPGKAFTIEQAIRRAQAIGFGADTKMAEIVAWSANAELIADRAFKERAIRFVVKKADNTVFADVQMVLEYVAEMHKADNTYSLKGRTWESVKRAAEVFMAERAKRIAAEQNGDWEPAPVGNYENEEDIYTYRIVQLLSSEELYEEGREMSHCVADYDYDCAQGTIAIFSLRKFTKGEPGYVTLATLDVCIETKELTEAKAKYNEMVSAEAEVHIKEWTKQQSLCIDCDLFEYYAPVAAVPQGMPLQYMGGEPVPQHVAEMPRVVPRPDPLDEHRRMMAERRYAQNTAPDIDVRTLVFIIIMVLKILMFLAR